MRQVSISALVVLLLGFGAVPALSQTFGAIEGVVSDESGGRLPGVTVTATNEGTTAARTLVSDAVGRYRFPNLAPGSYAVSAELTGFGTATNRGIKVQVNDVLTINFKLAIGAIAQEVVVQAEAPLVQTTKSDMGSVISATDIEELPLNGRSLHQLVGLQAGVTNLSQVRGNSSFSVGGTWDSTNLYMVDGARIQSDTAGIPTGSSGQMLGLEALQEFRVLTSNYAAEFGVVSGGVVNAVTKSGTNDLHGSAFEFLRDSSLDSANFFDRGEKAPFRRNQFGGSVGGPILRNRTFYFGTYEGYRDRLDQTTTAFVPDENARRGVLPGGRTVQVAPQIAPFVALYPIPNGRTIGGGIAEYVRQTNRKIREDYTLGKVNHQFSPNYSFQARYFITDGTRFNEMEVPTTVTHDVTRYQSIATESTVVLNPRLLAVGRFAFSRNYDDTLAEDLVTPPAIFNRIGNRLGNVQVNGLSQISPTQMSPRTFIINTWDMTGQVVYNRGGHAFKFGGGAQYVQNNTLLTTNGNGTYVFDSLDLFLIGQARSFESQRPDIEDRFLHFQQWIPNVYGQDDWKVNDRLTLNLGLRYEMFTLDEASGEYANLQNIDDPAPTVGILIPNNPSTGNVMPRFGFAWDVHGDQKLSVHGGAGIFYNIWPPRDYNRMDGPPFNASVVVLNNPPFPNAEQLLLTVTQAPTVRFDAWSQDLKNTVAYHVSLGVDRQLGGAMSASASYVGKRGRWIFRRSDDNTRIPTILSDGRYYYPDPRAPFRNPRFAQVVMRHTDARSDYNALQFKLQRRPASGIGFTANYTWSKAMDNSSSNLNITATGPGRGADVQNPYRPFDDRGYSSFDVRHGFNFRIIYTTPKVTESAARHLLNDWQINAVFTAQTGVPFTAMTGFNRSQDGNSRNPDRPNLKDGASTNPVVGRVDQWFDPTAFVLPPAGFYGNLARNSIISPPVRTLDFALVKNFVLGPRRLQFRGEMFNLTNRANFAAPDHTVFNSRGEYLPTAGRITSTVTSARQVQLGLRFDF